MLSANDSRNDKMSKAVSHFFPHQVDDLLEMEW